MGSSEQLFLRDSQYFISCLSNKNSMFELSGISAVLGLHGPSVASELGLMSSGVDHRLDCEDHPGLDEVSGIFRSLVVDVRFFVEFDAGSMSCIFTHNRVSMPLRVFGDLIADIPESVSGIYLLDPDFETGASHVYEFFTFLRGLPDLIHSRSIAYVSVQNSCHVYIEDIAFLEDFLL